MNGAPPEVPRFCKNRERNNDLPVAIAYCGKCNRWEPVNDKLTGYRFDCPFWKLDEIHIAAVIGTKWKHAWWVRRIVQLEKYQTHRSQFLSSKKRLILLYLVLFLTLCAGLGLSSGLYKSCLACYARLFAAAGGLLLTIDIILVASASAFSSQRPRFAPRSIILAVLGFGQLILGFALLHVGIGSEVLIGCKPTYLDLFRGLYFGIVTFATVGYGDIAPSVNPRLGVFWLVILQIVFGLYYLTIFVATIVSWVRGIQRPKTLSELLDESYKLDQSDLLDRQVFYRPST